MPYYVVMQHKPPHLSYWQASNFMSQDIASLKEARALAEEKADGWAFDQADGWQYRAAIYDTATLYDTSARDGDPPIAIVRPSKARAKRAELERIYESLSKMIWPDRSKLWQELTRAQRIYFDREYRGIR